MTNKEPIRAEWGEPMALQDVAGYPYHFDGEWLYDLRGKRLHKRQVEWVSEQKSGHVFTRPEGVQVLPPLEDHIPDARKLIEPIEAEVGMDVQAFADENSEEILGRGTISEVGEGENYNYILVSSNDSAPLEYVTDDKGWRFPLARSEGEHRHIVCAKTGRPVVLPSNNPEKLDDSDSKCQAIADSSDESEPFKYTAHERTGKRFAGAVKVDDLLVAKTTFYSYAELIAAVLNEREAKEANHGEGKSTKWTLEGTKIGWTVRNKSGDVITSNPQWLIGRPLSFENMQLAIHRVNNYESLQAENARLREALEAGLTYLEFGGLDSLVALERDGATQGVLTDDDAWDYAHNHLKSVVDTIKAALEAAKGGG